MGSLVVVTGPPGAGKSTVAALLADRYDPSALVRGDEFFAFLRQGAIAPWLPQAHDQNVAVIEAAAAAAGRLAKHCDVIYDGVVGPWFLQTFVERSGREFIDYALLFPPLDICIERMLGRTDHAFSDVDAAAHMWRDFQNADIDERHVLSDVAPASEIAREIAERATSATIRYCRWQPNRSA